MERDVLRLREFRGKIGSVTEREETRKRVSEETEEINMKTFYQAQKNYNYNSMLDILKKKLRKEDHRLTAEQIDSVAHYMIENYGGCPV